MGVLNKIAGEISSYSWGWSGVVLLLFLIILYSILLVKKKKLCQIFRNWILIPVTAIGGFLIYFVGYLGPGTGDSLVTLSIRSFISMFHMFLLHSDLIEVRHTMHGEALYMLAFSVIHLLAFLVTFTVIIQLFGKRFLSWVRLKISFPKESYFFFGLNESSVALAKDLDKTKKSPFIVFLDKRIKSKMETDLKAEGLQSVFQNRESLFEQVSKMDALWLNKEYTNDSTLEDMGIFRLVKRGKSYLFLFSNHTAYNIQSGLKIIEEISEWKDFRGQVELYVKAESDYMLSLFEDKVSKNVNVHIVNSAKLSALELILENPPVNYVEVDTQRAVAWKDFTVMILGFGEVGNYALRFLTEHGQFVGSTFHAIVVDKEMNSKQGEFIYRFPGMNHYDIIYRNLQIDSVDFWEMLDESLCRLDYIVVSLGDTAKNQKIAIDMSRYIRRKCLKPIDIFVRVHTDGECEYMNVHAESFAGIHPFGSNETTFTAEIIVNEARFRTANRIHEYYNAKKKETERIKWSHLSEIKKVTNISAAIHIGTKLNLAGLDVEKVKAMHSEAEYWNYLGTERLNNLAKGEHLHWNATLFANEWDTWKVIPAETAKNKEDRMKLHACLVDWEELETVEKRFNEPYREFDYDSVKKIYELIESGVY